MQMKDLGSQGATALSQSIHPWPDERLAKGNMQLTQILSKHREFDGGRNYCCCIFDM